VPEAQLLPVAAARALRGPQAADPRVVGPALVVAVGRVVPVPVVADPAAVVVALAAEVAPAEAVAALAVGVVPAGVVAALAAAGQDDSDRCGHSRQKQQRANEIHDAA